MPSVCPECKKKFSVIVAEAKKSGKNPMAHYKKQKPCCKRGGLKEHMPDVNWDSYRKQK
nr:hypothetical protein TetV2_00405 [Oceanusvirus sp.]